MEEKRKEFMSLVNKGQIILDKQCYICGSTQNLQLHHIIPLSNGGDNRLTNILTLCGECHGKVHNNNGLKIAREKISEKKKAIFILIDNQKNLQYNCNGWEEVANIINQLNDLPNYQYSKIKDVKNISSKTLRSKMSKITKKYPERIESTNRGFYIKDFMYKGKVDLIIVDTRRKDGVNA